MPFLKKLWTIARYSIWTTNNTENRATTITTPTAKRIKTNVHANSTFYDPSTWNFMWIWIFSHCLWSTCACSTITRSNGQWTFPIHFTLNSNYTKVYSCPSPHHKYLSLCSLFFMFSSSFLFHFHGQRRQKVPHFQWKRPHIRYVCIFAQFSFLTSSLSTILVLPNLHARSKEVSEATKKLSRLE